MENRNHCILIEIIFSRELLTRVKEEVGSQSQAEDLQGDPEISSSRNPLPGPALSEPGQRLLPVT